MCENNVSQGKIELGGKKICVLIKTMALCWCLKNGEDLVRVKKSGLKVNFVLCRKKFIWQF